jgi:methylenetetrahydrofolate reductase (NADPH)
LAFAIGSLPFSLTSIVTPDEDALTGIALACFTAGQPATEPMPKSDTRFSTPRPNQLRDCLRSGRFAVTAEIVPPASCDPADLIAKVKALKGVADAVNVTDGAGARSHMGSLAAAALLLQNGVEPILQLTCRDRNRIALQSDLLAAAALGIENLLLLRGDDPSAGDQPDAKPVFDIDTMALTEVARRIRDRQELMSGQKVSGKAKFLIGAADAPIDPPAGWKPTRLKAKIDAGTQFAQTQFCMDANVVRRYAQCLADNGLKGFVLLIGLAPIRSARSARWIRDKLPGSIVPDAVIERLEKSSEPVREGRRICLELVDELSDIPGAAGVHIMAPGNDAGLAEVVAEAAGIAQRKTRKPPDQRSGEETSEAWLLHLQ